MNNDARDIQDITAGWLSEKLGYEIRSFKSVAVGTGQTGASYRLTLDADQGPKTLLAKVSAGALEARERVKRGYASEVGFYAELLDTLDVRAPKCWYAAISDDHTYSTLLLEDLAPRVPGVQADGCSVERAKGAIRNLAGLHAPRWNDASLYQLEFPMRFGNTQVAEMIGEMTVQCTYAFVQRYSEAMGAENVKTLQDSAAVMRNWLMLPQTNFSVVHGDYRLDNLMFGEEANDVVALDWQTVSVAPPGRDLAYFIGTCLHTEQRRESEKELVDFYHQELLSRGVQNYDFERCYQDYRLGILQATWVTTMGCIGAMGERSEKSDAMFLAMANRSCIAIRDLETLELI